MADDNSIEQGGDGAEQALMAEIAKAGVFLAARPDGYTPVDGEGSVDALIRIVTSQGDAIAMLTEENAELSASLKAVKGHETRAKNALAVLRAECSPTARKVGRPRAAFGKPGEAYSPELAAIAIGGDEHVEIVFSDGKAEITSLPPVTAYPQAWLQTGGRHMLREPIELEGGDVDIEVAGFALLSGGEQVGWRELPDPIRVPKNGRVRLENCITF